MIITEIWSKNILEQYLISKAHQDFRPLEFLSKGAESETKHKLVASLIERAFKFFFENTIGNIGDDPTIDCNFSQLKFYNLNVKRQNQFERCSFKNSSWSAVNLKGNSSFLNCDFQSARISQSDFSFSQFIECNFSDTTLLKVSSISKVNFRHSYFRNCNFSKLKFSRCNFQNVTFDFTSPFFLSSLVS